MTVMGTRSRSSETGLGTPPGGEVEVAGLQMDYLDSKGGTFTALAGVDLRIPSGEFWVLLGPSGCGKTTLLRCLAGLEKPVKGTVRIDSAVAVQDGRVLLEAQERPVGMVFQSYALWPHMTVFQNIAYPLTVGPRSRRPNRSYVETRVATVMEAMQIGHLRDRKIGELSGGQQQRVALARAVVAGNKVVLFDEPLSNIDAKVREQLRAELKSMQKEFGFTAVYVTHDQAEAMDLADKIVVLDHGEIVQVGDARDIYYRPTTRHVAEFIGTSNLISGTIEVENHDGAKGRRVASTAIGNIPTDVGNPDDDVIVSVRAHDWWLTPDSPSATNGRVGEITSATLLGHYSDYVVDVDGVSVHVWAEDLPWAEEGVKVRVGFDQSKARVFVK
ncbi:ABC transporter ATP-binding protein [Rhodococcus wratislaviensis]|uniref:Trehalose import ATP-binding protein SugC n=1 Tax=Rhodococcus wratislaviensis NBRC 100605 TaxID=1219028 RepID=X0PXN0_RHOWR|nr:ABC transporter ATP-binding protein [Rhodococcus wratislaviensis]GAF48153.1 putative ABC transporter ATP-binding protein [Rhodococcus wratislaviensis NBRC 100605]